MQSVKRGKPEKMKGPWLNAKRRDYITAYITILPAVVLLFIFGIFPMCRTIVLSFFNWSFYAESKFVGLENYLMIVRDNVFWKSFGNVAIYTAWHMVICMLMSFLIAYTIKKSGRMGGVTKVMVYVPTIVGGMIVSYIFRFIYNYRGGLLNYLISVFGMRPKAWTSSMETAMFSMILPSVWTGLGGRTLIMLAGLNDIPESYYEAASLDGANAGQQMIYITLPCLKNVLIYLTVTGISGSLQMFDWANLITSGGPQNTTITPALYVYRRFLNDVYIGPSLAASIVLFLIVGVFTAIMFRTINSEKSIDG